MTIDILTAAELPQLWQWIEAEPEAHQDDAGPKTLAAFEKHITDSDITVFAVRTGKKLVGAMGFQPSTGMLKGVHFIPEVRGTALPYQAFRAVLCLLFALDLPAVSVCYLANNLRAHKFFLKSGGVFGGTTAVTVQNGREIPVFLATFYADPV